MLRNSGRRGTRIGVTMMFIPRNVTLETPTTDAILGSGIIIPKANVVHAHRGAEPVDLKQVPQGILMVLGEGLAFLATKEQSISAQAIAQHLTAYIASRGGPVGGIFRAVMAGATDLAWPEPDLKAVLDQTLAHPDTFVIPHVDIIQASYVQGSRLRRGHPASTVLTRENARGMRESVRITPTDSELAESLLMLRFMAERRAIRDKVVREKVDLAGIELATFKKFRAQYPSTLGTHRGRIVAEVMREVGSHLEAKGTSLAAVDAMVLTQLDYFRVIPQFAKYFAMAS